MNKLKVALLIVIALIVVLWNDIGNKIAYHIPPPATPQKWPVAEDRSSSTKRMPDYLLVQSIQDLDNGSLLAGPRFRMIPLVVEETPDPEVGFPDNNLHFGGRPVVGDMAMTFGLTINDASFGSSAPTSRRSSVWDEIQKRRQLLPK